MTREEAIAEVVEAAKMMADILEQDIPFDREQFNKLWEAIGLLDKTALGGKPNG